MENDNNNYWWLIIYKLLHDILFALLLIFALSLISESLIPGIISSHLSFFKITLMVFIVIGAIIYIGKKQITATLNQKSTGKALFAGLIVFAFLIFANSSLRFNLWEIVANSIIALLILIYFYKTIFTESHN
jgi:hypothetical protein